MSAPLQDASPLVEPHDEIAARRARRHSQPPRPVDHRTRSDYGSVLELLVDADRLVDDLKAVGDEVLLVPVDELRFTARRLRQLLDAATVELRRTEAAR